MQLGGTQLRAQVSFTRHALYYFYVLTGNK